MDGDKEATELIATATETYKRYIVRRRRYNFSCLLLVDWLARVSSSPSSAEEPMLGSQVALDSSKPSGQSIDPMP